jgi:small subunit ribosomal protein S17
MSDDETKKDETAEQEPQDAAAESAGPVSDEAADETPQDAGPVSDEASPEPGSGDTSSSPPASEAAAADASEGSADEAADDEGPAEPAADEASEDAPAAEAGAELPWKERRRLEKSRRSRKARSDDPEERKAERAQARKRKAALRRKQREAAKSAHTAATGTPAAERESNAAKVRQGIVVSSKGDKSITVRIDIARRHRTYEKIVRRSRTLHAHDERNEAGEGDVVRVVETRPLSKTKRWRLVDVVEKAR